MSRLKEIDGRNANVWIVCSWICEAQNILIEFGPNRERRGKSNRPSVYCRQSVGGRWDTLSSQTTTKRCNTGICMGQNKNRLAPTMAL